MNTTLVKKIVPHTFQKAFWLTFILCLAFCLMIIYVVSSLTGLSSEFGRANDGYAQLAYNLGRGNGYVFEQGGPPVFHRPPFYPLLLVPIMLLPEVLVWPGLILFQSVLSGFIGLFIFKLAELLFNKKIASLSVLIFLINPWLYWNTKNPMTPITQALLFMILVFLVTKELLDTSGGRSQRRTLTRALLLGLTAGALALTHGAMLGVNVAVIVVLTLRAFLKKDSYTARTAFVSMIVMISVISPWTYRNYKTFNRFIPITGGAGLAYFNGNVHWNFIEEIPQQKGETYIDASLRVNNIAGTEETRTHWKGFKDIELEEKVNQNMIEDIKSRPVLFLQKCFLNAVEYYFPIVTYPFMARKSLSLPQLVITVLHLFLWGCAVAAIISGDKKLESFYLVGAVFLFAVWFFPFATHIVHSLYSFGTIPILSILAAKGLIRFDIFAKLVGQL